MEDDESEDSCPQQERTLSSTTRLPKITVEPIFLVISLFYYTYSNVSKQYIYDYFSKYYGLENSTKADMCSSQNQSKAIEELEAKVSAASSHWVLYLNIASFVPSFFTTVAMGSWGDAVGRKPPLLCNITGYLALCVISIVVVELDLPLYYLLVAKVLSGLMGGIYGILCSCFSYIADASSHEDRTFRLAVGEATSGTGGIIASIACGIWIDAQGYGPPLWFMGALLFLTFAYIALLLPESNMPQVKLSSCQKIRVLFTCGVFSGIGTLLTKSLDRSMKLSGFVFCFFLVMLNFSGVFDTIVIYELSPPLCWSATLVGYGSAMISCQFLASVVAIKGFQGRFSDSFLVSLGVLSNTSSLIIYGFATMTWMMFLGLSVGLLGILSATVLRSMVSRFVDAHEQGAAFAIVACAEATANIAGSLLFNEMYSRTVAVCAGLIFFIGAGIYVAALVIFWFVYKRTKADLDANKSKEYESVVNA